MKTTKRIAGDNWLNSRNHMERRKFIALLGGAGAAWPLRARAQQPERMRRIGVLMTLSENDPEGQARLDALRQGLKQIGSAERKDPAIEYRLPGGGRVRLRAQPPS